ncbi:MAG: SDR family oxidoreductase [Paracoccus sp. (in: a-proteobacteria)]|uniref:SDR family oxidoreductase n=1 Tax=Paracoccus sp. TaxID=267 RepID=UPI0026DEF758|nr:SDR family oxidoreductase [Paracoccus sp. (in: a-proteobacteria)]MDO5614466.1 SDR family oxidoreductase [Paracoccus sp. (in: a-proteobacteria)]
MPKTVLITGTSKGIGQATVLRFARAGWNVAATMRNPADADPAFADFPNIAVIALDITDPASIEAALKTTRKWFGQIDAVVNNAGYGQAGYFEAVTDAQLRANFDTNFFGTANVMRAILPEMRARREGVVLNVSSVGATFGIPSSGAYVSTKWALEGLCESAWHELTPLGVHLKVLEPAGVNTPFLTAPTYTRASVGIDDYEADYARFQQAMSADHWALEEPETIADRIFDAVTDGTDRFRYFAGPPLNWLRDAKRKLSDQDYEQFMAERFRSPVSVHQKG